MDPPIIVDNDTIISFDPADGHMTGPNSNANAGRLGAFIDRLESARDLASTDPEAACDELDSALSKLDGPNAWFTVTGDVAFALSEAVMTYKTEIGEFGCP